MKHINRMTFIYVIIQLLCACNGIKTYRLLDNGTKVPIDQGVYSNKSKFDLSLFSVVDTNIVYEEYDRRYNTLKRLDNHLENSYFGIYKFYPNGALNSFLIDKKKDLYKELNPLYNGYRGVFYTEEGKARFDLFAEVNQQQNIGKLSGTLMFGGDTMYVKRDDLSYVEIYVKRKLPKEYFQFKADW